MTEQVDSNLLNRHLQLRDKILSLLEKGTHNADHKADIISFVIYLRTQYNKESSPRVSNFIISWKSILFNYFQVSYEDLKKLDSQLQLSVNTPEINGSTVKEKRPIDDVKSVIRRRRNNKAAG